MTIADWERIVSTLGIPVSMLIVIAFAVRALMKWAQPWAEKMMTAHMRLLETCETTLRTNTESLQVLTQHTLDPNGPCQRTVASLKHAAQAIESMAGDKCPDVVRHAQDMRKSLE